MKEGNAMKRVLIPVLALLAACAALGMQISETITAKRIGVYRDDGQPAVVASVDQLGNGEFVVFDNGGREVFAVRGGAVETRQSVPSSASSSSPQPTPKQKPSSMLGQLEADMRERGVPTWLLVNNPNWMDEKPRLALAVLDYALIRESYPGAHWRYALRIANVGNELIEEATVRISFDTYPDSWASVRLTRLPAGEAVVFTKTLTQPGGATLSRRQLLDLNCEIREYRARE
jgi:hypothetical protein